MIGLPGSGDKKRFVVKPRGVVEELPIFLLCGI